ncbi:MAG: hypothetical protein AAF721_08300 [Myxococcota bacterium]
MSLATALVALLAAAPPSGSTVQEDAWLWTAPAECPSSAEVQAEVERHLGRPTAELPGEAWSVVGIVTFEEARGYAVALAIETADGRHDRLLHEPASCDALSDSAALLIAVALSPDVAPVESPPPPEPTPEPTPEPPPKPKAPVPEAPPPPTAPPPDPIEPPAPVQPPPPLQFAVGLMPGIDWGTLRGVTPTGRLALSWQLPRLRAGLAASFGGNRPFTFPSVLERIGLQTWSLAAEVGPVPKLGRFEFPIMGGLEAGQLLLTPRALLPPGSAQVAWVALLVTPGVAWVPLRWLAVTARVGSTVSLVRPSFEVAGFPTIHQPAPVGVRASLGIEIRVPLVMKPSGGGNEP